MPFKNSTRSNGLCGCNNISLIIKKFSYMVMKYSEFISSVQTTDNSLSVRLESKTIGNNNNNATGNNEYWMVKNGHGHYRMDKNSIFAFSRFT